jgi:hypothetical protein
VKRRGISRLSFSEVVRRRAFEEGGDDKAEDDTDDEGTEEAHDARSGGTGHHFNHAFGLIDLFSAHAAGLKFGDFTLDDQVLNIRIDYRHVDDVRDGAEEGSPEGGQYPGTKGAAVAEAFLCGCFGTPGFDGQDQAADGDDNSADDADGLSSADFLDRLVETEEVEHEVQQCASDGHSEAVDEGGFHGAMKLGRNSGFANARMERRFLAEDERGMITNGGAPTQF